MFHTQKEQVWTHSGSNWGVCVCVSQPDMLAHLIPHADRHDIVDLEDALQSKHV